jgi:hypothetical protein
MKSKPILIALLLGVAIVCMVLSEPSKTPTAEQKPAGDVELTTLKPLIRRSSVQSLENWTPPNPQQQAPEPVPERMKRATDDPYVAELLATFRPVEIGQVQTSSKGKQQLLINGNLVFEAQRIGSRSISSKGVLFVDAVIGELVPIEQAEANADGKLVGSPREIWRVMPGGTSEKISPAGIDASNPVVSPDGSNVAYTGREIDANGFPGTRRLYVVDLMSNEVRVFGETGHVHNYTVRAIDWRQEGKVLRAIEDWGETGGHMKLKQVRVQ